MNWAVGIAGQGRRGSVELIERGGIKRAVDAQDLCKVGVPDFGSTTKLTLEGPIDDWAIAEASDLLRAAKLRLPKGCANRHRVFTPGRVNGLTVYIPALVLMRTFFRPANPIFDLAFTPSNLELISFTDYSTTPPSFVVDHPSYRRRLTPQTEADEAGVCLRWLRTSMSAKRMMRSVFDHAGSGYLAMDLPHGNFRLRLHGTAIGRRFFASRVHAMSVVVDEYDSITKRRETFYLHKGAKPIKQYAPWKLGCPTLAGRGFVCR